MKTANLRHLITIQQPTATRSATGAVTTGFATPGVSAWAAELPDKGREFFAAKGQQNERSTAFRVRYTIGVSENCRVVKGGVNYHVVSAINEHGLNKYTIIYCVANLNATGV